MRHDLEIQSVIGHLETVNLQPKIKEGLEGIVRELMALNDIFQVDLLKIESDEMLTELGKTAKKQELGDGILEKLQPYGDAYKSHIAGVKNSMFGPKHTAKTDTEILIDYLKNQELRSMHGMAEMDPLQLEANLDDPAFLQAVVTSPKPLLPADKLNELVQKQAEKQILKQRHCLINTATPMPR